MQGEVKFFNDMKNYGFIAPESGGEDVFFHRESVDGDTPSEGDTVEFESEEADRGPRATSVELVEAAADAASDDADDEGIDAADQF
jgi:CspA family cold shock protein